MREVKVKGEDLSGLGWALKSVMDGNMQNREVWASIKSIKGSLVVREKRADVAVTVFFNNGEIEIENGAIAKPTAYLAGGFDELSEVTSKQVGPIKALITGKIKARGNLLKLLKMANAIILSEEA